MSIRRFTMTALLLGLIMTLVFVYYKAEDQREFPEKLEEAIQYGRMKTYHDNYYDYEVQYPAFFEQRPDSLIDEQGFCHFSYWDNWVQVELTAQVIPNTDSLTTAEGMQCFADLHHAHRRQLRSDSFVLSGPLYINGSQIPEYRFYAKYVHHRKLWFVQTLTYPDNCARAVRRLIRQVDEWPVWEPR